MDSHSVLMLAVIVCVAERRHENVPTKKHAKVAATPSDLRSHWQQANMGHRETETRWHLEHPSN